jgi:type I restriction enzyme, S subunit
MKSKPLGEFDIYINDGNYGGIYPEKELFLSSGVPFISASDFSGRIFNYQNIKYISHDLHYRILKKGHLKLNDVVIVVRGNGIGKVGFFKDSIGECNINAQLAFIRTNPVELDPLFLYYLFSSKRYFELIRKFGSGSAQPQLPINRLKLVPVLYPSIGEQKQIGSILGSIDNKIELNHRINAELEAMAKIIYDYWFVQFDFPISAAQAASMGNPNKNGKPYKASGGKMVWSEELKREIPEGWVVGTVNDLGPHG